VIALLGDIDPRNGAIDAPGTRLVRFSLPGGRIEVQRDMHRGATAQEHASLDALRLHVGIGPLLATTRDGGSVLALLKDPRGTRDRVGVIDPETLRLRCSLPLQRGVRYTGLLLGRSRVYAFGVRRVQRGLWDAVVTVRGLERGGSIRTHTVRQAVRARMTKDWLSYGGALSADERRLVLSYHGGDTTGADLFRVSGQGISPAGRADRPGRTDIGWAHGAVEAVGGKFLAATGSDRLLELNRDGRVTRRLPVRAVKAHLMDLAVDADRRLVYLSSCGVRPTIERLHLADGRRDTISSGNVCGRPMAGHADRYLVLDATEVGRLGYSRSSPDGLRLLDLRKPGSGRRIALPRSVRALDAEVVRVP
jgi:hypothetical protein